MATEQTDAIILRTYPWSETSLIANMYTRDFGKISAVAKGARRAKSPFEVALDLLSYCRVVFIAKSSDSLDILTGAKLEQRFRIGARDLMRLYAGYYVAELLDRLTDKGDKQPELFELALETLRNLADLEFDLRAIVLRFELQSLAALRTVWPGGVRGRNDSVQSVGLWHSLRTLSNECPIGDSLTRFGPRDAGEI